MRRAEEQAGDMEAVRTLGVYEERKHKLGKITKKKWFIIDPRTSNFIPYWDAVGMVRTVAAAAARGRRPAAHSPVLAHDASRPANGPIARRRRVAPLSCMRAPLCS